VALVCPGRDQKLTFQVQVCRHPCQTSNPRRLKYLRRCHHQQEPEQVATREVTSLFPMAPLVQQMLESSRQKNHRFPMGPWVQMMRELPLGVKMSPMVPWEQKSCSSN
jgi:hypothetical protein